MFDGVDMDRKQALDPGVSEYSHYSRAMGIVEGDSVFEPPLFP